MALTKASALHHWSARYGINPRVGGRPVFTRNGAGLFVSQENELDTTIVNTPRFDWATLNLPNGQTERRKVLTLEMAATNAVFPASDVSNAAWTKSSTTIATGTPDPAGGTQACTVTAIGPLGLCYQALSAGASIARTNSLWLRRRTGVGAVKIVLAGGAGVGRSAALPLTAGWLRFNAPSAADVSRYIGIELATSGDQVDWYLSQQDDRPFATSEIPTSTGAASRAADVFYWNYTPVAQALMMYVRFVESGTILSGATTPIAGISSGLGEPLMMIENVGTGVYGVYHGESGAGAVLQALAAGPALGQTVEHVAIVFPDGSVQIIQSLDGAAATISGHSVAKALTNWADQKLWLNVYATTQIGSCKYADVRIVKYADVVAATAQGILDELRGFELGPNGDVL
jgi:hypothetical protein